MKESLRYQAQFFRFFKVAKNDISPSTIAHIAFGEYSSPQDLYFLRMKHIMEENGNGK